MFWLNKKDLWVLTTLGSDSGLVRSLMIALANKGCFNLFYYCVG